MIMASIKKAKNTFRVCPFLKNSTFSMMNHVFTDDLLPPMPFDQKFRVQNNVYGVIKGGKGWEYLYSYVFFAHYKK